MDEQEVSLVSWCARFYICGVMQETSAVINRCHNYFLSSSKEVVAFHTWLCRWYQQKWSLVTDTVFWYINSLTTICPSVARDMQDLPGTVCFGAERCYHHFLFLPLSVPQRWVLGLPWHWRGARGSSCVHRVALQTELQICCRNFGQTALGQTLFWVGGVSIIC